MQTKCWHFCWFFIDQPSEIIFVWNTFYAMKKAFAVGFCIFFILPLVQAPVSALNERVRKSDFISTSVVIVVSVVYVIATNMIFILVRYGKVGISHLRKSNLILR